MHTPKENVKIKNEYVLIGIRQVTMLVIIIIIIIIMDF